jgi:hypothetical protein
MLKINRVGLTRGILLTASLASGAWVAGARAADAPQAPAKDPAQASTQGAKVKPVPSHYQADRFAGRAGKYYELFWGIDSIVVKLVESGELVRFSYRVLDPAKAKPLNEKANVASLDDPQAGVSLVVPTMEKIGALRQSTAPEAGHSYWMTFSNKGRRVARGHRVDVVIGPFKASNLVVD